MSMHICFHVRCRGVKGVVKEAWFNAFMMWPMVALNICSVHQMCVFVCASDLVKKLVVGMNLKALLLSVFRVNNSFCFLRLG